MSRPVSVDRTRAVAMYQRGVSTADIAAQFGVRTPAVRMMLSRAGVYRPGREDQRPTRSPEARAKVEAQKVSLAEHIAEGGSFAAWERDNGTSSGWARQIWLKILRDLGPQAA